MYILSFLSNFTPRSTSIVHVPCRTDLYALKIYYNVNVITRPIRVTVKSDDIVLEVNLHIMQRIYHAQSIQSHRVSSQPRLATRCNKTPHTAVYK